MQHDPEQCKKVFALLSEYLDLELPPGACAQIEKHLSACAPCVEFAESLRKTIDLCHRYTPQTMPRPLSEAAREQLWRAWQKMVVAR